MMSQNKDPRNTPGPDADPSDAFLDALSERAAADSQANLANGGRVIEAVFNDPTVRAALGDHVPIDRNKDLRAKLFAQHDAILRDQRMDDNAYWERPEKAQRRIILKHQFSGAKDSHIAIEVVADAKVIYVDVEHDPGRIPVSQIAQHIVGGVDLGGEDVFDDDTTKGSVESLSRRTPWRIVIRSGQQTYRLVITKQLEKNWDYDLRLEPKE